MDVLYVDKHTAGKKFDVKRLKQVQVVGQGKASIMDGSYRDTLKGVVLGKIANLQVNDPDWDVSAKADALKVTVEVRRSKTPEEIDEEIASLVASGAIDQTAEGEEPYDPFSEDGEGPKIDKFKTIDSVVVSLKETIIEKADEVIAQANADSEPSGEGNESVVADSTELPKDDSIHSGIFRGSVSVENLEAVKRDQKLQALPSDFVRVIYQDKLNVSEDVREVISSAKCIEGNVGGVRVTKTRIDDEELRLRTELKTAAALAEIGNHYKEFGLADKAKVKYMEAIAVGEETAKSARKLKGRILEESYVGLWKIYFAMENYGAAAAMSRRLQNEFPESPFVDDAILQQANVAKERGDLKTAISLFRGLTTIKNSELRGEGQFGIAECYEQMALDAGEGKGQGYFEQAFRAYQGVYENFPESGRVGDAVAKMANFYYKKKDYRRAIDVFETVLEKHPDAGFLDVILFNYGRCLYRVDRKGDARRKFDQIINEFPDSNLAGEAKRISEALAKSGN